MSKQSAFPYTRNLTTVYVGDVALKLWKILTKDKKEKSATGRIHNIGISFGGLSVGEAGQKSIEGFLAAPRQHRGKSPPDHSLRPLLHEAENPSKKRPRDQQATSESCEGIDEGASSFVCSRCSKRIALPPRSGRYVDDHSLANAVESLKIEHEDFHFAQDLALDDNDPNASHSGSKSTNNFVKPSSKKARKTIHSNEGIAKYFSPQLSTPSTSTKGPKK